MNCPLCSQALSERGSFCKWCGAQARCTHCKELLEPDAKACVECGTLVGSVQTGNGNGATAPSGGVPPTGLPPNRNTITYREDRNSRDFEASLTDSSMQSLGGVFGELFATRVGRQPQTGQNRFFSREGTTVDVAQQLPAPSEPAASPESQPLPPAQPATAEGSELASVRKIFHQNGEALELGENRLKATSGRDYVRRLTYLFLYAHELHGRSWTPRSELLTVLKEAKVWDHNSSHWLRAKKGFRVDPDDRLQLIQAGRDEAKKTLAEALDSNVNDEWNPDTRTVQKRGPRKQKSS